MEPLKELLKGISEGKKIFKPEDTSETSMQAFQPIAKALVHANERGYLDKCNIHRESRTGHSWYDLVSVQGGLSYLGKEYLASGTSSTTPKEPRSEEDIIELNPNISGIGVNLNALWRWWKNRNKKA
jgi:hypothetical protein